MTKQEINHFLKAPHTIAEEQLFDLQYLLQRYPYFQSLRILIAKVKHHLRSPDARNFLTQTTLYATDLKKLKTFIRGKSVAVQPPGNYNPSSPLNTKTHTQPSTSDSAEEKTETLDSPVDYVENTLSSDERAGLVAEVMQGVFSLKEKMTSYEANEVLREQRETEEKKVYEEEKRRKAQEEEQKQRRISEHEKAKQEESERVLHIEENLQQQIEIAKKLEEEKTVKTDQIQKLEEQAQKQREETERYHEELKKWQEEAQKWKEEAKHQEKKTYINEQIRLQGTPSSHAAAYPPSSHPTSPEQPVQASAPVQVIFGQSPQPSAMPPHLSTSSVNPFATHSFPIPHLPLQGYPFGYSSPAPYTSYGTFSAPQPTPPFSMPTYLQPVTTPVTFTPYTSTTSPPPPSTTHSSPQEAPNRAKQDEIIERFIKKASPEATQKASTESNTPIHDEICSEELAQLYENQGYKERAIEIYRRLCYKYPEKKQFFVTKINELKK